MPLMASLWTGTSGLLTSSNALNTTAHNMTNIDTDGYTRQQVQQGTRHYNMINKTASANAYQQVGLGVEYTSCRQVRSVFLDQSYRQESGRAAFYNVSYDCLVETEDLLQEMNGAEFADSMDNLWRAIQDLDREPANTVNMNTFISRSSEFINRAQAVYQGLINYQQNMDQTVDGYVKTINEYGDRISELNKEIVLVESGHREHANDLRDERNLLLDKLGELARIDYSEDTFGNVSVYLEDTPFVLTDHVNHMAVDRLLESSDNFATPYWEFMATTERGEFGQITVVDISNAKVFDLTREVSSVANTDVGKLRSILLARGDHNATYHDIMLGNETLIDGSKLYDTKTDEEIAKMAESVKEFYNSNISQSVVMNIEAEFDALIHNVTEKINSIIENAASNPARKEPETYVENYKDLVAAVEATTEGTPDRTAAEKALSDAVDKAAKKFDMFTMKSDDTSGIVRYNIGKEEIDGTLTGQPAGTIRIGATVMNLKVNEDLIRNPSLLSMRDIEGNEDKKMTEALKQAFKDEDYALNPQVAVKTSFVDYYNSLVAQVANSGDVYDSITDQQNVTVSTISSAREQIVGVSSDEELEFMIKFQNAYNAASRYINVVSEMLEHIVSTLGR